MSFLNKFFKNKRSDKTGIGKDNLLTSQPKTFKEVESLIYPYFKQVSQSNEETYQLPDDLSQVDKSKTYHIDGVELIIKNICADLNCFYAIDIESGYELIINRHLEEWQIDELRLHEIALGNFRNLVTTNLKGHGDTNGLMFTLNGNLEAGLILIDEIWTQLEEQVGEPVVTAIPSRDVVVVTGKSNRVMIDNFKEKAINILINGDHPLSKNWFIKTNQGWTIFEKIMD